MSWRIRFTLLLSLIVSAILICTISLIYIIYAVTRTEDYNKRLWAESIQSYKFFFNTNDIGTHQPKEPEDFFYPGSLVAAKTVIINKQHKVIYNSVDSIPYIVDDNLLNKILSEKEFYFTQNNKENIGLFISNPKNECFVITSAYDIYGKRRLKRLRIIMTFVTLGGIMLTGLFAFFYVNQATKPLLRLGLQMQNISENNLQERVYVNKNKTANNELSRIAFQFNDMLDRLEKAFQLQKNFVHHASHELRTPLANMLSQTESAISKNLTPAEAREVLYSLKEDQQEMIELTNSLLLLSQYERLNYSEKWPILRLDEVLYESIDMIKRTFPHINISLEFLQVPDNETYLCIRGNDALLRSAFRNLVKNAFIYSENKNVKISIDTQKSNLLVHFENEGKVLTKTEQDGLFIPFFRGENAQRKKGFGLGLSIVNRIIYLHRGTIYYSIQNKSINRFSVVFKKFKAQKNQSVNLAGSKNI